MISAMGGLPALVFRRNTTAAAVRIQTTRISSRRRQITQLQSHSHARRMYSSTSNSGQGPRGTWRTAAGTAGNVLIIGSVMTLFGYIMYTLYDNLLADSGTTRVYNESLDLIRANPQIRELFGSNGDSAVVGFGEPTHSQRQRHRSIAHRAFVDEQGRQRLTMQYYIRDAAYSIPFLGIVKLDMVQSKHTSAWDYNYVVVDVYPIDRGQFTEDWMQRTESSGSPVGRVKVLVTDEFADRVHDYQKQKRNQRFSTEGRGSSDGSWLSVLNPGNWRK
ncbi:mitochondrial import inner membrane translocase subunit tim21 [Coemansia sp. RSA 2049]|nr:mitochondrial import inner membrane translocase subunit tim21 [Coemansia sp. RSA 2049]KAJ2612185.1 mitochondrial import inner membrane translocase subunit tim21 [Coemansia sp. RSA 1804]